VVVPQTPVKASGFHDDQLAVLEPLLGDFMQRQQAQDSVVWLDTPMALPLVKTVRARCLVYDCMDELAAFKDAPRQLRQRESALLKQAALVFTGGPSLYEARRGRNPNVHCIPGSVDVHHFEPSRLLADSVEAQQAQALQGALPRPRLGFFGVIDERLDAGLVGAVADAHPEWQLVMAGPVVGIDPQNLPQRPNIRWLGLQPYSRLAGWDLCLMPFALNESTRFISPTKTLEYMAGEKPIVSTPIDDVVLLYGNVVGIAHGAAGFVAQCEEILGESAAARCRRAIEMLTTVSTHSWNRSADSVHRLLTAAMLKAPANARAPVELPAPRLAAAGARS